MGAHNLPRSGFRRRRLVHRQPRRSAAALSPSSWGRVQRALTAGLFVAATLGGGIIGLQGASISPVSPNAPAVVVTAAPPPAAHGQHQHR